MFDTKKLALFLGGVVFGSAGFKVLSSKDAKKDKSIYNFISTDFLPLYSLVMPSYAPIRYFSFIKSSYALISKLDLSGAEILTDSATRLCVILFTSLPVTDKV